MVNGRGINYNNMSLKEKVINQLDIEMIFIDEKKIEEFNKKLEKVFA